MRQSHSQRLRGSLCRSAGCCYCILLPPVNKVTTLLLVIYGLELRVFFVWLLTSCTSPPSLHLYLFNHPITQVLKTITRQEDYRSQIISKEADSCACWQGKQHVFHLTRAGSCIPLEKMTVLTRKCLGGCFLVAERPGNMLVYLRDGSAQFLRAATL